ncbi:hypothetical protein STAS_10501, partial [Striga asiatica]
MDQAFGLIEEINRSKRPMLKVRIVRMFYQNKGSTFKSHLELILHDRTGKRITAFLRAVYLPDFKEKSIEENMVILIRNYQVDSNLAGAAVSYSQQPPRPAKLGAYGYGGTLLGRKGFEQKGLDSFAHPRQRGGPYKICHGSISCQGREIKRKKTEMRGKIEAHLGRVEEEAKRLAGIHA